MTSIGNCCQPPQFGDAYGAPGATAGAGLAPQAAAGPDLSALLGGGAAGAGLGAAPAAAPAGPSVGMGVPAFGCGANLNTMA